MRKGREPDFIYDGDTFVGVDLSADYCAEHECGIKQLQAAFGYDEKQYGVDRRRTRLAPQLRDHLRLFEHDGTSVLAFHRPSYDGKPWTLNKHHNLNFIERYLPELEVVCDVPTCLAEKGEGCKTRSGKRVIRKFHQRRTRAAEGTFSVKETLATAWDEGTFAIRVKPMHKDKLDELYAAIVREDAVIMLGGGGVFRNAGLIIAIASRIPLASRERLHEADYDHERLLNAAEMTGIEAELRRAGLKWFALAPRWRKVSIKSAHDVVFWLNPYDQDRYNYGWFTVEELREWADGRGPVIRASH